jgi:hypothetical protein
MSNGRIVAHYDVVTVAKKAFGSYFEVLSQHLAGGTEVNDEEA